MCLRGMGSAQQTSCLLCAERVCLFTEAKEGKREQSTPQMPTMTRLAPRADSVESSTSGNLASDAITSRVCLGEKLVLRGGYGAVLPKAAGRGAAVELCCLPHGILMTRVAFPSYVAIGMLTVTSALGASEPLPEHKENFISTSVRRTQLPMIKPDK